MLILNNKKLITSITIVCLSVFLLLSNSLNANAKANEGNWNYKNTKRWGGLCNTSKEQSPINIYHYKISKKKDNLDVNYKNIEVKDILHKRHNVYVNFKKGSYVLYNGTRYNLMSLHFHTPSEHIIKGKSFAMEGHFVNQSKDGKLLVVAVLFKHGRKNRTIQNIIKYAPQKIGDSNKFKSKFLVKQFIRLNKKQTNFYTYEGSLTTPPCTDKVRWIVISRTAMASAKQINQITKLIGGDNNRPIQKRNGIIIYKH